MNTKSCIFTRGESPIKILALLKKSVIYTKKSTKLIYPPDRYSNLFLNACLNCHVHVEYFKMIKFYSPFGMRQFFFLYSINTNKNEKYLQNYLFTSWAPPFPSIKWAYERPATDVKTGKATYTFTCVYMYFWLNHRDQVTLRERLRTHKVFTKDKIVVVLFP